MSTPNNSCQKGRGSIDDERVGSYREYTGTAGGCLQR